MKAFIVHPTYTIKNNKPIIELYGRLEDGRSFITKNEFQPYFFIKTKDTDKAKTLVKIKTESTNYKNFQEEKLTKITTTLPKEVKDLREIFEKNEIQTFESDIRFEYRYLIDHNLQGTIEIKGQEKQGKKTDIEFENPTIKPAKYEPQLKTMAIDIETSMNQELYSISIYSKNLQTVLIKSKEPVKNYENLETEKELLQKFQEIIIKEDPDIILGWNIIDFDLRILQEKFKKHNLQFNLGRNEKESTLRIESSFMQDSKAEITGRMVLDGIRLLKISFIKLQDYKLDTAAKRFLQEEKLIQFESKGKEIEELYKNNKEKLAKYNLKDSELTLKILEKSGVLDLTIQRSLLTGMPLDRVMASIASLDSVYLKELRKIGYVAKTSNFTRGERTTGGYVMKSKPGIYDSVIVLDFKSLYPSIIRTFNIDPLAYDPEGKSKKNIEAPNGAKFKNTEGILPSLIQKLWKEREKARKEKNELARYAIKILMNSFYGVLASPNCRFYSYEMANAITSFAHQIIKTAIEKVETKYKKQVIYGDTDSIFIDLNSNSLEESEKIGTQIAKEITEYFKQDIKEKYNRESFLELEFEKTYKSFLMPTVRGSKEGAKKRYAGLLVKNGKEKMDFTGLEFVRRDWTELSKKFQLTLLNKIFHKQEVQKFIKKFVEDLKKGKYDNLLTYKKALRKDPEEYTKTTPPHVKAARLLDNIESNIIEYIITTNGPEPLEKLKSSIDYEHYIEKQIKPIADSVLGFYNTNFDDLMDSSSQKSLFNY